MKNVRPCIPVLTLILLTGLGSCEPTPLKTRTGLPGNNIVEFVQDKKAPGFFTDPVDDTAHFKKVVDNIYRDGAGKIYILSCCFRPIGKDTAVYLAYYKEVSDFLSLETYKQIKNGFFQNKGKVYTWGANSDGNYPIEVKGADPETFIPFDRIGGGTDRQYVFYIGDSGNFEIIKGADPKTIRILNPQRGCWDCGSCYFVDHKSVYYGRTKIEGADPGTFKLCNKENMDGEDKVGRYFEGKRIP